MDDCPFEHVAVGDQVVEALGRDEVVVDPIDLTWPGLARGGRDAQPHLRMVFAHVGRQSALAHGRRTSQHGQP